MKEREGGNWSEKFDFVEVIVGQQGSQEKVKIQVEREKKDKTLE